MSQKPPDPETIGDEKLNDRAMQRIRNNMQGRDEQLVALSGFDFESKVIAVTTERVLITSEDGTETFQASYQAMPITRREGRTLILNSHVGPDHQRFHMGQDQWVARLVRVINDQRNIARQQQNAPFVTSTSSNPTSKPNDRPPSDTQTSQQAPPSEQEAGIAQRVRFWEEQDRINQELIPRVLKQHELLTSHIALHENLPTIAADSARQAAEEAANRAREEARRELEAAIQEREELAAQLVETVTERQRLQEQLERASRDRESQEQQHQEQIGTLRQQADEQETHHQAQVQELQDQASQQDREHQERVRQLERQRARIFYITLSLSAGTAIMAAAALVIALTV